jgi:hypothetical protein
MMPQAVAGTRLVRDTATGVDAPWPVFDRVALAPLGCLAERAIIAEDERRLPRSVRAGVLALRIENLQLQNDVSRVLVSDAGAGFGDDLERLARWTSSGNTGALLISAQNLRRHLAGIRVGELRLLCVDPSWGAESGVIAEGFYLSDGQE